MTSSARSHYDSQRHRWFTAGTTGMRRQDPLPSNAPDHAHQHILPTLVRRSTHRGVAGHHWKEETRRRSADSAAKTRVIPHANYEAVRLCSLLPGPGFVTANLKAWWVAYLSPAIAAAAASTKTRHISKSNGWGRSQFLSTHIKSIKSPPLPSWTLLPCLLPCPATCWLYPHATLLLTLRWSCLWLWDRARVRCKLCWLCAICQSHVCTLIDLPLRLHSLRRPCAHAVCVLMYLRCLALCGSCCAARVCL